MAMTPVPYSYKGGLRQKGVSGSARVFASGHFGLAGQPLVGKLRPVDPKLLINLTAPAVNPALWGRRERHLLDLFMYALASDIKHILGAVLKNADAGKKFQVQVAAVTAFTKAMRSRNRTNKPLREFGLLARAMDVEVIKQGQKYLLVATFNKNKGKEKSGSRKTLRDANKVAAWIENGFNLKLTQRMKKYFQFQAAKLESKQSKQHGSSALKNIAKGMMSRQSVFGWLGAPPRAGGPKVGTVIRVTGRPFVSESIEAGIRSFHIRYGQTGWASAMLARQWMRGNIIAPQRRGRPSPSGGRS